VRRFALVGATLLVGAAAVLAIDAILGTAAIDVTALATRTPRRTALMRAREAAARREHRPFRVDQRTVPYERISPLLRHAVLVAEDDAFYSHGGLDWSEIRASARRNLKAGRIVRGGSTITQQLAKNLYLGDERTVTRKLKEAALAIRMERALSKRRIFELYLNLIEWGDGIFGAEAAARHRFGVAAADLDARQACLLAAVIINPRRYSALDPEPRIESRVRMIASRLRRRGVLSENEYLAAIGGAPPPRAGWLGRILGPWFGGTPDTTAGPDREEAPRPDSGAARGAPAESLAGPGG